MRVASTIKVDFVYLPAWFPESFENTTMQLGIPVETNCGSTHSTATHSLREPKPPILPTKSHCSALFAKPRRSPIL